MAKKDVVLDSKHEDSNPPSGQWRRVVFNDSSLENPRTTWFVLSIVTLFAVVIGVFGVLSAPSRDSGALYYQVSNDTLSFNLQTTIIPNSESRREKSSVFGGTTRKNPQLRQRSCLTKKRLPTEPFSSHIRIQLKLSAFLWKRPQRKITALRPIPRAERHRTNLKPC